MALKTWNGTTNGHWDTASNWASSSVPANGDDVVIASSVGNALVDSTGGTTITLNSFADYYSHCHSLTNIDLSVLNDSIFSYSGITLGGSNVFYGDVIFNNAATVPGGIFKGVVTCVANSGGLTINGGLFYNNVNMESGGSINDGTFYGVVNGNGIAVNGGIFYGAFSNYQGTISGGLFIGSCTVGSVTTVSNGQFSGPFNVVSTPVTITYGTFNGPVDFGASGFTVSGGTFSNSTLGSSAAQVIAMSGANLINETVNAIQGLDLEGCSIYGGRVNICSDNSTTIDGGNITSVDIVDTGIGNPAITSNYLEGVVTLYQASGGAFDGGSGNAGGTITVVNGWPGGGSPVVYESTSGNTTYGAGGPQSIVDACIDAINLSSGLTAGLTGSGDPSSIVAIGEIVGQMATIGTEIADLPSPQITIGGPLP